MISKMVDIPEEVFLAAEIGTAIETIAIKLLEFKVVTDSGYAVLAEEGRRLKAERDSTSWDIFVDRDNAIEFQETFDKNGSVIYPRITCPGISVVQEDHSKPPFRALDIAIEINNHDRLPVARWHVDWANSSELGAQPGPLVHLQYGGHNAGHRDHDHPLKVPRWCHPPMDLILICEVMAANFYEDEWESLREDQNWCGAISLGQRLCYSAYMRKISVGLSISSKTILHSMWAAEWLT